MNVVAGRIAAAVASAIVVWMLGLLGVEVTEEEHAGLVAQATQAVTMLGMVLWGVFYGVLHKLFNRKLNPADTAKLPERGAANLEPTP